MINEDDMEIIKVIIIGASGVGKTSILWQYINKQFNDSFHTTIGCSFYEYIYKCDDKKIVKLEIWDTAGQERFRSLTTRFFQNSQFVILVYDISSEDSFRDIKEFWYPQAKEKAKADAIMALVGNKEDLLEDENFQEQVDEDTARSYAIQIEAMYFKISSKSREKVEGLFDQLVKKYTGAKVLEHIRNNQETQDDENKNKNNKLSKKDIKNGKKRKCC